MQVKIGLDVGNYDTKTQHTSTPSKFSEFNIKPMMSNEWIYYNGVYYAANNDRSGYVVNKNEGQMCLILAMFGIAKELIYSLRERYSGMPDSGIQEKISEVDVINLGVGLPPAYYSLQAAPTTEMYKDMLGNGVEYQYFSNGHLFTFNFRLGVCTAFPQDYTAVYALKDSEIVGTYSKYYIVGIGGGTVDIVPVVNGLPDADNCDSLDKGTKIMYAYVAKKVKVETNIALVSDDVERVLRNESSILPDNVKDSVKRAAQNYVNELFYLCKERGLEFQANPVVFFGGGTLLLREFIEKNPSLLKCEFVEDVNGNAKYYARLLSSEKKG